MAFITGTEEQDVLKITEYLIDDRLSGYNGRLYGYGAKTFFVVELAGTS